MKKGTTVEAVRLGDVKAGVLPVRLDDTRICYWKHGVEWWLYLPGVGAGSLANHTVVEHEDGTVTVAPSILQKSKGLVRHGYLERSVWREV